MHTTADWTLILQGWLTLQPVVQREKIKRQIWRYRRRRRRNFILPQQWEDE